MHKMLIYKFHKNAFIDKLHAHIYKFPYTSCTPLYTLHTLIYNAHAYIQPLHTAIYKLHTHIYKPYNPYIHAVYGR